MSFLLIFVYRSNCWHMFFKICVLKNFTDFTEKHLCWSLILVKLQTWFAATLLKRDSNTFVFLWNLLNFSEHLFFRTPLNCYVVTIKKPTPVYISKRAFRKFLFFLKILLFQSSIFCSQILQSSGFFLWSEDLLKIITPILLMRNFEVYKKNKQT